MFVIFFFTSTNIVLDLSFHFVLMFFASLSFSNVCFCKCVFIMSHFFVISFIGCQIHFDKFYFLSCTMVVILVKEVQLMVWWMIWISKFETKVFNRYDTFYQIANRNKEDLGYAYLYCDLLNKVVLIIIIFRVKSLHINMHEQYLQKCMFMKVESFCIESKSKR
jgi:hypothetical protein